MDRVMQRGSVLGYSQPSIRDSICSVVLTQTLKAVAFIKQEFLRLTRRKADGKVVGHGIGR